MVFTGISKKISKYRLKKKSGSDLEFDEATPFIHSDAERILGDNGHVNAHSKFALYAAFALISVLILQTFKLQIVDQNKFAVLAENNRLKEINFRADRGIIYDKNKNILVRNKAIFDLVAIPREVPGDPETLKKIIENIAKITKRDYFEISGKLEKINRTSYRSELILDNLDIASAIAVESGHDKMPGFEIKNNAIREYSDAEYFSHIIGYTGRVSPEELSSDKTYDASDFIGKAGLEAYYEEYLRGEKGSETVEMDAGGRAVAVLNKTETKTGGNLVISMDTNLQKKLQDALKESLIKIKQKEKKSGAAAAVALDPRNGKILALVSLPSYDNNIFSDPANKNKINTILFDPGSPMLNRVIAGNYPPGSTIKPVMSIAALSENIITKNTIIEDRGVITIPNPFNPALPSYYYGWNRSGLGPMNVISALAQSSDIFFYTVGGGYGNFKGLGADRIFDYFKEFNLGSKLGIDLPSESGGFVPTREWKMEKEKISWNPGDTYHISIGQGYLLTTPLQVASWTSVMANKGTLFKPYLVDKIISSDGGSIIKEFNPQPIKENIADKKYINIVREGMREAVLSGSARALRDLKFKVAGKTGTAEYGTAGNTHAWFTVFAPYDNPEIVLTILLEGGGEGGINAVPVAKDILNWYFEDKK